MTFSGFYIDDNEETESVYARLLSTRGELTLEYKQVREAAELASDLFDMRPDVVVIDFRLDENLTLISPRQAYKGSALAQLLRDKATNSPDADFPIILISAENKFNSFYRPDGTAHDLFDRAYVKQSISEDSDTRNRIKMEILSLCRGYKFIKETWTTDRLSIFGLPESERHIVDVQDISLPVVQAAAPHLASRLLIRNFISRTGLLLSDRDVAARLGIEAPHLEHILPLLVENGLGYTGVFSDGWRRWWTHRFDGWAEALFERRPTSLTGTERAKILKQRLGVDVAAAKSAWSGSSDERFAFACACCGRPTEVRHSLSAFDRGAPRHAQQRRICWDCIQVDRHLARGLAVDEIDAPFVEKVKADKRRGNGKE